MSQKRTYKQYSTEFKEEAVSLVNDQGYSVPEAAKALGINPNMLYRWKEKFEAKQAGSQLSESERDELIRLRKENRKLLMEKEILKKASAFFAKEMK
ncbi:Transposase [Nitrincola nitratireducens]|uniref:Transposase n=1 Tax=Nitrincola nitratireducens TaxID=1229521 RepID=W9V2T9_9GAMM|nr:Transposase [Nitrincola nitratireducens]